MSSDVTPGAIAKPIIDVRGVSKRYRLGTIGMTSLRDELERIWARTRARWSGADASDAGAARDVFWALRDVSFQVAPGEVVGIIGRNGAGKSTLLKILSRITRQTAGEITLRGRVASLLEVGTGFHPELSGRENIFLNGAILGMTKAEIRERFDEIVAFAEVEQFLDTPVKRYSSGMYVRLAFAVAAHLQTDVLIVDEVLAVGDAAFQSKCLDKMGEVSASGRTVLFVSHNLSAVQGLCSRAVWLDHGEVAGDGPTERMVAAYLNRISVTALQRRDRGHAGNDMFDILQVIVRGVSGEPTLTLTPWEPLDIEIIFSCRERIQAPYFWIGIESRYGSLFCANMLLDGRRPDWIEGEGALRCRFGGLALLPQNYTVIVGARDASGMHDLCAPEPVAAFSVVGSGREYCFESDVADGLIGSSSPMLVPYEWHFPDGTVTSPQWTKMKGSHRDA